MMCEDDCHGEEVVLLVDLVRQPGWLHACTSWVLPSWGMRTGQENTREGRELRTGGTAFEGFQEGQETLFLCYRDRAAYA